jgi:hypothetical protein
MKRRAAAQVVIKAGILAGELPAATDPDVLLDALYGGLYYRLLMGTGSLSDAYVEAVWRTVLRSSMLKSELGGPWEARNSKLFWRARR